MLVDGCWYAIQVKPRFERAVGRLLAEKGYETFVPLCRSRRRWSDRVKALEVPMFPNYVFCRILPTATGPIVTTLGVVRIVGAGSAPIPVDDGEVDALQRITAANLNTEPWRHLTVGQRVQVESGPLAGVTGVLCRIGNGDRLIVSVTLLCRAVAVEFHRAALVAAPAMSSVAPPPYASVATPRVERADVR